MRGYREFNRFHRLDFALRPDRKDEHRGQNQARIYYPVLQPSDEVAADFEQGNGGRAAETNLARLKDHCSGKMY